MPSAHVVSQKLKAAGFARSYSTKSYVKGAPTTYAGFEVHVVSRRSCIVAYEPGSSPVAQNEAEKALRGYQRVLARSYKVTPQEVYLAGFLSTPGLLVENLGS